MQGTNAMTEIAFLRRAQDKLLPDFIGVASRNVDGGEPPSRLLALQ
jgi:hypothetical protein